MKITSEMLLMFMFSCFLLLLLVIVYSVLTKSPQHSFGGGGFSGSW